MRDPDRAATVTPKRAVAVTLPNPDFDAAFPGLYRSAYRDERLVRADELRRLPRRQREVAVLPHLCDASEADTARALRCSTGPAKQHATRGLASLRRHLEAEGYR